MRTTLIGIGIFLACVAVAAILIATRERPEVAMPVAPVPSVQTASVVTRDAAIPLRATGTVQASEEVAIAPEVGGRLVYVHPQLRIGGRVTRGEVLLRIDATDYENAVEQALADVRQQEVQVLQASEERRIAEAEFKRFQARLTGNGARENSRILPPAELETQPPFSTPAEATSPSLLVLREPQLRAAEAAQQRANARLEDARERLSRTTIRAPFSGIVRSENVAPGAYVSPGQALAQIVASSSVEVIIPIDREDAALLPRLWSAGTSPADVYLDYGDARYRWEGIVERASAILDDATRTIDVIVLVPNPIRGGSIVHANHQAISRDVAEGTRQDEPPPLFVGELVHVDLQGISLKDAFEVPREAIRSGDVVWVAVNGTLRIVPIRVIQQIDDVALIQSRTLAPGDAVITSPLRVVTEGMRIRTADGRDNGVGIPDDAQSAGVTSAAN
ncbi:MAG: efflux RND transporter periplasmic adaptor subunit [Bacteroidota bacterium]